MMAVVASAVSHGENFERQTERGRDRRRDRRPRLDAESGALPRTKPWTQRRRDSDYGRSIRSPLGFDVVVAPHRIRALFVAGDSRRGLSCALIHDPARLRPRLVLSPAIGERLGRPRDRRIHTDTLRFLAAGA